jgi:hypothetical protein
VTLDDQRRSDVTLDEEAAGPIMAECDPSKNINAL